MDKNTVRILLGVICLIFFALYFNVSNVDETTMLTESTSDNLAEASDNSVYPSNLDITNFKGSHINSGILKVTIGESVSLNYKVSYYGEGDSTALGVQSSPVNGVNVQVTGNKNAAGLILVTVNGEFSDVNIIFSVTGGAKAYSQSIRLEKVPGNENDNIPPITNTPEEQVNPYLNMPKEPVESKTNTPEVPINPDTNMPEEPVNPKTNAPEEPVNPGTNMPKEPVDPKTNIPEVPTNTDINIPEEPINPKAIVPKERNKQDVEKKAEVIGIYNKLSKQKELFIFSEANAASSKKSEIRYPKTGDSLGYWSSSLSMIGLLMVLLIWKVKK
ncbi:hypothetical protein [Enterococcus sp. AZ196]|uniref:hypothetical protein n=1 Tax=Enterococcus sp. AZ196 TaxID=2774659 RepID=UPI003D27DD86